MLSADAFKTSLLRYNFNYKRSWNELFNLTNLYIFLMMRGTNSNLALSHPFISLFPLINIQGYKNKSIPGIHYTPSEPCKPS